MEPHARRLRMAYEGRLAWRCVLGGMIADWGGYEDPVNNVRRPAQMAPHWYDVAQTTGMPADPTLWHEDPPSSSYPACLAVAAAGLQGAAAAEAYLRRLREAALVLRRNVARAEVLIGVAEDLAADPDAPRLDPGRLRDDLTGPEAASAFARHLREARDRGVARFPTLVVRRVGGPGLVLTGYRPFDALRDAAARAAPDVRPSGPEPDPVGFVRRWGRALAEEVAAALDLEVADARRALEEAADAGAIGRDPALPGGYRAASAGPGPR
jgi:predicted DsbA family dithiol-disulfide isomerase